MKPLYISATGQNVGKTTVILGLFAEMCRRGTRPGYIKPVGQRWNEQDGVRADEDAFLLRDVLDSSEALQSMSPVTIPRGFVDKYIMTRDQHHLQKKVCQALKRMFCTYKELLIEGTGHAGVGSCIDLSNAEVARLIGARVVIISGGGIGKVIDEITLNRCLFESRGVEVVGAILNKVTPDKQDRVRKVVGQGLANLGTRLLGVIPYDRRLTVPTVGQIATMLKCDVISGKELLDSRVENTVVGAMEPQNMVRHIAENTLVITPGDRIDNILVSITFHLNRIQEKFSIAGLVLTGGLVPHFTVMDLLRRSGLPALLCQEDTYATSSRIRQMVFKIRSKDSDKIATAQELVLKHVDLDGLLGLPS
ncbi:MAG: AAA family ATPase [Actinobacteria bacterium]|nr:AAA family ATPase [Actinomycetota bacterium]